MIPKMCAGSFGRACVDERRSACPIGGVLARMFQVSCSRHPRPCEPLWACVGHVSEGGVGVLSGDISVQGALLRCGPARSSQRGAFESMAGHGRSRLGIWRGLALPARISGRMSIPSRGQARRDRLGIGRLPEIRSGSATSRQISCLGRSFPAQMPPLRTSARPHATPWPTSCTQRLLQEPYASPSVTALSGERCGRTAGMRRPPKYRSARGPPHPRASATKG